MSSRSAILVGPAVWTGIVNNAVKKTFDQDNTANSRTYPTSPMTSRFLFANAVLREAATENSDVITSASLGSHIVRNAFLSHMCQSHNLPC
jgi:hypothetical protein